MYRRMRSGRMNPEYITGVRRFINFAYSIERNVSFGKIRCPCVKCKNQKFQKEDDVCNHLLRKGFLPYYKNWTVHGEPYDTDILVGLSSEGSNCVVNDKGDGNPYRNMVIDAMRMNQGNVSQCPIVEEEPNAEAARFFDLLKDSDEPLWDGCTNHSKLSAVAQVFTIKSDHRLSEAGYDKIIEWARSILPEGNRLKENFYAAKSMMKPLGLGYQKIDMCPNFCMLYYLENAELTECMTCGH